MYIFFFFCAIIVLFDFFFHASDAAAIKEQFQENKDPCPLSRLSVMKRKNSPIKTLRHLLE